MLCSVEVVEHGISASADADPIRSGIAFGTGLPASQEDQEIGHDVAFLLDFRVGEFECALSVAELAVDGFQFRERFRQAGRWHTKARGHVLAPFVCGLDRRTCFNAAFSV